MTPYTTQRESVTIKVLGRATHNTCKPTMLLDGPRLLITVCNGGETFGYEVRFRNVMKLWASLLPPQADNPALPSAASMPHERSEDKVL